MRKHVLEDHGKSQNVNRTDKHKKFLTEREYESIGTKCESMTQLKDCEGIVLELERRHCT